MNGRSVVYHRRGVTIGSRLDESIRKSYPIHTMKLTGFPLAKKFNRKPQFLNLNAIVHPRYRGKLIKVHKRNPRQLMLVQGKTTGFRITPEDFITSAPNSPKVHVAVVPSVRKDSSITSRKLYLEQEFL